MTDLLVDVDALDLAVSGVDLVGLNGLDREDYLTEAAAIAEDYVRAYCTRGLPDPAPPIARRIAASLALRQVRNPLGIRQVSVEGQSADQPFPALTAWECVLLGRWRHRAG